MTLYCTIHNFWNFCFHMKLFKFKSFKTWLNSFSYRTSIIKESFETKNLCSHINTLGLHQLVNIKHLLDEQNFLSLPKMVIQTKKKYILNNYHKQSIFFLTYTRRSFLLLYIDYFIIIKCRNAAPSNLHTNKLIDIGNMLLIFILFDFFFLLDALKKYKL